MKYLKIDIYDIYAAAIIAFAAGLRIVLIALGWPPTNSDESTMGIMALHVAYHGEYPVIFYGQNYMGTIEAYLGAFFFHLFGGPSLFALRFGVVLLVTLFFIVLYLLASVLYSKKVALATLVALSIGSIPVLTRQTIATGGSSQTLFFGSLAFLLATWLSLTYKQGLPLRTKLIRLCGYSIWGLIIGLGIWTDMVVLPTFAMAGLLLLLFCWRDLLLWAWPGALLGGIVGALPTIEYDIQTAHGQNPWSTLLVLFKGQHQTAPHTLSELAVAVKNTIQVSIPTATGDPFCPVNEIRILGDNAPHTIQCTLAHGIWGLGYLILLGIALFFALNRLWHFRSQQSNEATDQRQTLVRYIAGLLLLGSAILAAAAYTLSSGPTSWPAFHARYLITLLVATPALIAPLWSAASIVKTHLTRFERVKVIASRSVMALVLLVLLTGTWITFSEVSTAQNANQQWVSLIGDLEHIGATHIYTDYWTCNNLAFLSNERVICGVINGNLDPSHNRAPQYYDIVHADPHSAYVFPIHGQIPAVLQKVQQSSHLYWRYVFDGYIIYQPV